MRALSPPTGDAYKQFSASKDVPCDLPCLLPSNYMQILWKVILFICKTQCQWSVPQTGPPAQVLKQFKGTMNF